MELAFFKEDAGLFRLCFSYIILFIFPVSAAALYSLHHQVKAIKCHHDFGASRVKCLFRKLSVNDRISGFDAETGISLLVFVLRLLV